MIFIVVDWIDDEVLRGMNDEEIQYKSNKVGRLWVSRVYCLVMIARFLLLI